MCASHPLRMQIDAFLHPRYVRSCTVTTQGMLTLLSPPPPGSASQSLTYISCDGDPAEDLPDDHNDMQGDEQPSRAPIEEAVAPQAAAARPLGALSFEGLPRDGALLAPRGSRRASAVPLAVSLSSPRKAIEEAASAASPLRESVKHVEAEAATWM